MTEKPNEDFAERISSLEQELQLFKEELSVSRQNEARYQDIFEHANDLVHSLDPEGNIMYVNQLWRDTLGYSSEDAIQMKIFDIIEPDHKQKCRSIFNCMMKGEKAPPTETVFKAKDGRKISVEGRCNPKFKDGKAVELFGIFRDITDRKLAEKNLKQAAREWRNTFDSISDFVSVHDSELRIVKANKALAKFLNTSPQDLVGK